MRRYCTDPVRAVLFLLRLRTTTVAAGLLSLLQMVPIPPGPGAGGSRSTGQLRGNFHGGRVRSQFLASSHGGRERITFLSSSASLRGEFEPRQVAQIRDSLCPTVTARKCAARAAQGGVAGAGEGLVSGSFP